MNKYGFEERKFSEDVEGVFSFAKEHLKVKSEYPMKVMLEHYIDELNVQSDVMKIIILYCKIVEKESPSYIGTIASDKHDRGINTTEEIVESLFSYPVKKYEEWKKEKWEKEKVAKG